MANDESSPAKGAEGGERTPGGRIANIALPEEIEQLVIRARGMTSRTGLALAVDKWLPTLVEVLTKHGFVGGPLGRMKPRRLHRETLTALQVASERTGIGMPDLLRACMRREAATLSDDPTQKEGETQ